MTTDGTKQSRTPAHEFAIMANDNYGRMIRVYRYLRDNGPSHRDKIMHWTGFSSPKDQPVIAYVEFCNEVMRLDRILRRHGMGVEGGIDTGEVYRLMGGRP